jgi:hypothetical protein
MKNTIAWPFRQLSVLQMVVLLRLLLLAGLGRLPDSEAGWMTCPPHGLVAPGRSRSRPSPRAAGDAGWPYVMRTAYQPLVRSLLLAGLWFLGGRRGPPVLVWWPWLWQMAAVVWPRLSQQPGWRAGHWLLWQGQRVLLVGYGSWAASTVWQVNHSGGTWARSGGIAPGSGLPGRCTRATGG